MPSAREPRRKIRILIADQEGVFRLGLRKLFGLEDDLRVVAQAENGAQIPGLARKFKPDLLFVQAELVGKEPEDLFSQLRRAWPDSKIIITASVLAEDDTLRYVQAGAAGVILKSVEPALFVKSVRKVMHNELWLPKQQVAQLVERVGTRPLRPADTLTRREKTIISCLMQGWRNREIAEHLRITEQTVKNHLRTVFDKVGVSDRLELALYAIHQHMELPPITPPEAHR